MLWLVIAVAIATLLLTGCTSQGIMKMGLSLKLDIFGAKAQLKLPVEFYPLLPDAGYPEPSLVCE